MTDPHTYSDSDGFRPRPKGQHFLLSARARTLSLSAVLRMTDDEARETFKAIRWASNGGEPFCPRCGCVSVWAYKSSAIWRCRGCQHKFSVTSGTIFSSRQMPIRDYLAAIAIFVNGAKGISALQLSRDLDVQYKTAFVLAHKLREAMAAEQQAMADLSGVVEVDGAYFGGHIRPANDKEKQKDRRLAENQTGKRRSVVIARERGGRTLPVVVAHEAEAVSIIRQRVASGTIVHADEAAGWEPLHASYDTRRINHSKTFSDGNACTNQAESFFSRLRRAEIGTHHHISGKYLDQYANEMAWREDHRRISNGEQWNAIAALALQQPPSRTWAGYWQRNAQ